MTTPIVRALAVLCLVGCGAGTLAAQEAAPTLKELNALLATFCSNKPTLTLAADGIVVRKDSTGDTMTFKLCDIGEITIDPRPDAQAHVLLRCKEGTSCVEWTPSGGAPKTGALVVFSITPASQGPQVVKLFKDLQASLASATKK
jgi:hypothetical protein